jgi:hypothetical protein
MPIEEAGNINSGLLGIESVIGAGSAMRGGGNLNSNEFDVSYSFYFVDLLPLGRPHAQ